MKENEKNTKSSQDDTQDCLKSLDNSIKVNSCINDAAILVLSFGFITLSLIFKFNNGDINIFLWRTVITMFMVAIISVIGSFEATDRVLRLQVDMVVRRFSSSSKSIEKKILKSHSRCISFNYMAWLFFSFGCLAFLGMVC